MNKIQRLATPIVCKSIGLLPDHIKKNALETLVKKSISYAVQQEFSTELSGAVDSLVWLQERLEEKK